jgi:hypothetical protein
MFQDLVDFVYELRGRGRVTTDLVKEFEKDRRNEYISFASFRSVICKVVDKSYSDNSKAPLVMKLIQPFEVRGKVEHKDYRYNYQDFVNRVEEIMTYLHLIEIIFEKILKVMKDGRTQLFNELGKEKRDDSGLLPLERFVSILKHTCNIDLKEEDKDGIENLYGIAEQINFKMFEADFKKWFAAHKRGESLETLTNTEYIKSETKKIFVNFQSYFKRYNVQDPRNYFKEFNAVRDPVDPDNYLISRYSFKEAVYNLIPNLPEEQYTRFENTIAPDKFQKLSTKRFIEEFEKVKKDITPGELDKLVSKIRLTKA